MEKQVSEAALDRAQAAYRVAVIATLGMEPEPVPCPPGERYAAGTGEMVRWLREDGKVWDLTWQDFLEPTEALRAADEVVRRAWMRLPGCGGKNMTKAEIASALDAWIAARRERDAAARTFAMEAAETEKRAVEATKGRK